MTRVELDLRPPTLDSRDRENSGLARVYRNSLGWPDQFPCDPYLSFMFRWSLYITDPNDCPLSRISSRNFSPNDNKPFHDAQPNVENCRHHRFVETSSFQQQFMLPKHKLIWRYGPFRCSQLSETRQDCLRSRSVTKRSPNSVSTSSRAASLR